MAFVVKIKFENTLRRLTFERGQDGSPGLRFADLVAKIQKMFQIPLNERLVLTYVDQDDDLVTMFDDNDLHDAWFIQNLNPLRLHVNLGNLGVQELKDALNKSILLNSDTKLNEDPILGSSSANSKKISQGSREISRQKGEDQFHAYIPSVQAKSKPREIGQRVPQVACRISMDGRRNQFTSNACKHHPQMLQRRFQQGVSSLGKLDARFVCDITIFDGTEVTAGTHFTKIWRLRNVGTCPWPPATLLVQTGGDFSGTRETASVELPKEGLPCDEEVNIATDFVAPELPGRYVSHWRLQAPSGQKFGQRVWALIKVVSECLNSEILNTIKDTTSDQELLNNDRCNKNQFQAQIQDKARAENYQG